MSGHLNLDLNFPVPLACLLIIERVAGRLSRRYFVFAMTLTLLAEFGLSVEVFASFCSLGVLVMGLFIVFAGPGLRTRIIGV